MNYTTENAQRTAYFDQFDCQNKECAKRRTCYVTADHVQTNAVCVNCKKPIRQRLIHSQVTSV